MYVQYIQGLCQSRRSTAEYALISNSFRCNRSQSHIATDGQSVNLGVEPHLGSWPDIAGGIRPPPPLLTGLQQ
jgi:hypothetical protein